MSATAPEITLTAVRTRKGGKASIAVTAILPDGTEHHATMSGARADRAAAVWLWTFEQPNYGTRFEMGCLADPAAAQRKADGLRKPRRLWDFDGTRYVQVTVAFPAGWALVEDAAD